MRLHTFTVRITCKRQIPRFVLALPDTKNHRPKTNQLQSYPRRRNRLLRTFDHDRAAHSNQSEIGACKILSLGHSSYNGLQRILMNIES